ncbi:MAG: efflux RND transporter periplasmic adaptor subunit [Acidobacteriaceae bacterium]
MNVPLKFFGLLAFATLVGGCSKQEKLPVQAPAVAQAQLVQSTREEEPQLIWTTGTVHARESATLSAQVSEPVRRVLVQAGDRVRAGQVLVVLDDAAMRSQLNEATAGADAAEKQQMAAKSNASLAESTLARYQMLKEQKSVSPQEFDEMQKRAEGAQLQVQSLEAQNEAARAQIAGARTQMSYAQLRAPFSGVVTQRLIDPGALAAPGLPLLQIDSDGPLQIYSSVDESEVGAVTVGMKVPVKIDGVDTNGVLGTVAQIVPAADPASRSFQVKLNVPAIVGLRAGLFASVGFPGGSREMVLAPRSAVVARGSLECVYAVDSNGMAQLRYVTLGNTYGDQVEMLSGLGAGESLVNDPGDRELQGLRIEGSR